MRRKVLVTVICPILAALIWGVAFSAQSASAGRIGPFTFNAARSTLSALVLGMGLIVWAGVRKKAGKPAQKTDWKRAITGGALCGAALCIAANLQQAGLETVVSGKAGFITALYVVLVPVFGLVIGRKAHASVWIGVGLAVVGLYLLCVTGSFVFEKGDVQLIGCAAVFAIHIFLLDHFTESVQPVLLSCLQFAFVTLFSWILAFMFETPSFADIRSCIWQLLYVGILSGAGAYTLQIIAQKEAEPAKLSLLLSLESVFSVLSGAVFLGERLTGRELIGCAVMFAAVLLAELPPETVFQTRKKA